MKRFIWLWNAVAGAFALPMLTIGGALLYLGSLWGIGGTFMLSVFHWNVSDFEVVVPPACIGFALGALSAALWRGRSFKVRALCSATGVAATTLAFGLLWRRLETSAPPPPNILGFGYLNLKQEFLLLCVKMAPTLLWTWALLFAALFVRSARQNPKQELALQMAAGAVAGAVLLPLVTGFGPNVYLLQTNQDRSWIGEQISLFWVQMPIIGAVFGISSIMLWRTSRPLWLRVACVLYSLGALALTWQWAKSLNFGAFVITSGVSLPSPPGAALVALVATPTVFWALGLLFFSLVVRSERLVLDET